jgi:hypothetical protein
MLNPRWPPNDLTRRANDLLDFSSGVVYVGLSMNTFMPWPHDSFFCRLVETTPVTAVEIWEPQIAAYPFQHPNLQIHLGDIRNFPMYGERTDTLVWLHGPEHLDRPEGDELIAKLKEYFAAVILETPVGIYPQGEIDGNPFQVHRSGWWSQDFRDLGFLSEEFRNAEGNPIVLAVTP